MISAIALVTGASAVFVGSLLLRTWRRHGGASGTSHFRRQILGHAAVGIVGVVLVVVHLAAGRDPRWGWTGVVVLMTASALGATMFLPWWSRGRKGLYGDQDPAGFYPAESQTRSGRPGQHISMPHSQPNGRVQFNSVRNRSSGLYCFTLDYFGAVPTAGFAAR